MENEMEIRPVVADEIEVLKELAKMTFVASFGKYNTKEDMDAYVAEKFTTAQVRNEWKHPHSRFHFACLDKRPIGYLKINTRDAQTDRPLTSHTMEIERIYVMPHYQNRKIGQYLFNYSIALAHNEGFQTVWLGVWDQNIRAIRFYERNGFEQFGTHEFYLGSDKQNDILMKLDLI